MKLALNLNRPMLLAGTGMLMLLSACGDSSSSTPAATTTTTTTPAPVAAATPQAQIGTQFATDYNASNNSTPVSPAAADVGAVSLTGTPIALH